MDNTVLNIPNSEQVRFIFKDTYNLYVKYKNIQEDEEFEELVKETHELHKKYPFELCEKILVELLSVIEKYYNECRKGDTAYE